MFHASFHGILDSLRNPPLRRCLVLESVTKTTVFAYCTPGEVDVEGRPVELELYHYSGMRFGMIRRHTKDPSATSPNPITFSVVSRTHKPWRIDFQGSFPVGYMCAQDETGQLLAIVEVDDRGHRMIRVAPLADAGLLIISVLGMELLVHK